MLDFRNQNKWTTVYLRIEREQILFVVEVTRGGYSADEDQGDVLIDNVEITDYDAGTCKSECSCD